MFLSPYFWGCKYTNYFLFINKNIEIQHLGLLITRIHRGISLLRTRVLPVSSIS